MPTASIIPVHTRLGINNRLLLALSPATLDRLLKASEPVALSKGEHIETAGQPITHIHFINRGLVCATKAVRDGRVVEIAAIGIEGIAEFVTLLGMDRSLVDTAVRIPGMAIRIRREVLMHEMEGDRPLRELMQAYVCFGLKEVARHVACIRLHHLDQRCCRWLLIAHDHALSDDFPLTHEDLAMMLGYQRAGVSVAMASLVKAGLIEHKRGRVIITDRPGLEAASCECYREMQTELDEFLPAKKSAQLFEVGQNTKVRRR
ncbi:Crp/Fnr family transcriptional regulator [Bradyrhizobium frederickii]|uniref:Crp/Fnr family transcriptional regulator n=1 Tax=Bradyrhizobium frederickii TaxID=2560054 RepID=A0A4Y9P9T2_9BRAD|nr:Crp/Fnr family transcriptional regulator [Bradyrhizobium frederickii]TFV77189.1 Crp/Fnr family transcriptional regulator [Bradyrhizobium frederickii]